MQPTEPAIVAEPTSTTVAPTEITQRDRLRQVTPFRVLHCSLLVLSAFLPSSNLNHFSCLLMFGIVLSQSVLAAVWLVLGPGKVWVRLLVAPAWLFCAAAVGGSLGDRPHDAFGIMLASSLSTAVAVATVIGLVRLAWRMRLADGSEITAPGPFQYRLKHMLILMLVTSLLLGMGRVLGPELFGPLLGDNIMLAMLFTGAAWATALLPLIFGTLAAAGGRQLLIGHALAHAIALATGFAVVSIVPLFIPGERGMTQSLALVGFAGYLLTMVGLLLQWWSGTRLVRGTY